MIASVYLGWAIACVGRTELCAIFQGNFGQMLWVWLKGPDNRFRCETAHNVVHNVAHNMAHIIAHNMACNVGKILGLARVCFGCFACDVGVGRNADMQCPNPLLQYVIMCCGSKAVGRHSCCSCRKRMLTFKNPAFQNNGLGR